MASEKLLALKEYIEFQATDDALWSPAQDIATAYIQEELRRVAFLIESASVKQIKQEIKYLLGRMP